MTEQQNQKEVTETKEVKVISRTLFNEKIVVIYKKIKPDQGPLREMFNPYWFNIEGEAIMLERDAIIFWKQHKEMKGMKDDLGIFSIESGNPYNFDEVKDKYKVKTESLSNSEPPKQVTLERSK